jgi:hypothetical protein
VIEIAFYLTQHEKKRQGSPPGTSKEIYKKMQAEAKRS